MAPKCKICGLPEGIRKAIERDIRGGLGVVNIVKKYPQAELNAGNVYTHKKHLILVEARDVYDYNLMEKAEKQNEEYIDKKKRESEREIPEILESPDKMMMEPPDRSGMGISEQMATNLVESQTTGNRIMDDVLLLDTIIQQGRLILDDVTPKDVLGAIKLKHDLLNGVNNVDQTERIIEVRMGVLLQQIAKEDPVIVINSEPILDEQE